MAAVTYAAVGYAALDPSGWTGRIDRSRRPRLASARPAHPALRRRHSAAVYRRRRLVAAVALLGLLVAGNWVLGALGGGSLTASGAGTPSVATARTLDLEPVSARSHVVAPGDTLWSIARRLQPEGDVRPVVDALAAARGGRPLQVGERIVLP